MGNGGGYGYHRIHGGGLCGESIHIDELVYGGIMDDAVRAQDLEVSRDIAVLQGDECCMFGHDEITPNRKLGQNVLDTVPIDNRGARSGVGNLYSQYSPFGFNGTFWYAKLGFKFNTGS